ncbi:MAG: polysaccharide biosynthesis C-terminal domain-containing protein [Vicinamibacterales bacterium]
MSGGRAGSPALALGEALARLVAFGTTVYLARVLGPGLYGVVAVAAGVLLYLTQIADAGVELAGMTDAAGGPARAAAVAGRVIAVRLGVVAVLLALVWPLGWWGMTQPDGAVLALSTLALPFTALSVRWIYLGLERPTPVAVSRIVADLVGAALTFALVRSATDVRWAPVATAIGLGVGTALLHRGLPALGVRLRAATDHNRVTALLARGRRLVLFTLLGLVLYNVDLLILRVLRGETAAGQYAAAYVLISFCANLMIAYSHTVLPAMARDAAPTPATASAYGTGMVVAWIVTLPVAVGGALVAPWLVTLLFGSAYAEGAPALQVLVLSVPIAALREMAVAALIARHRESSLLTVNSVAAVVNVGLNLWLIPRAGVVGAAWATVVSEIVRLIVAAMAVGTAVPGARPWQSLARVTAAGAGMGLAVWASGTAASPLALVVGGLAYPLLLLATGSVAVGGGAGVRVPLR